MSECKSMTGTKRAAAANPTDDEQSNDSQAALTPSEAHGRIDRSNHLHRFMPQAASLWILYIHLRP